jgi:hypothetical protein
VVLGNVWVGEGARVVVIGTSYRGYGENFAKKCREQYPNPWNLNRHYGHKRGKGW